MKNRQEDMEIESHYRRLLQELDKQRQSGLLCDACVLVEGYSFKAHQNVLLASSRYFKTLYAEREGLGMEGVGFTAQLDIVTVRGFKPILDFMYSAHLALTGENVIEVMSAASYLQMTDIVHACHAFIRAALDISPRCELANLKAKDLSEFHISSAGDGGRTEMMTSSIILASNLSAFPSHLISPANSSADSAIASNCGKEDQDPRSNESLEEASTTTHWPEEHHSVQNGEEQSSPSSSKGEQSMGSQSSLMEPRDLEEHSGSRRRKNRKNKNTVRHIIQNMVSSGAQEESGGIYTSPNWRSIKQDISGGFGEAEKPSRERLGGTMWHPPGLQEALMSERNVLATEGESFPFTPDRPSTAGETPYGRKRFCCPCCSFSATHQCILRRHLRSHTGERPYPCATCGKKFTRREHMKRHAQVHSKEKTFGCKECGRYVPAGPGAGDKHGLCGECEGRQAVPRDGQDLRTEAMRSAAALQRLV